MRLGDFGLRPKGASSLAMGENAIGPPCRVTTETDCASAQATGAVPKLPVKAGMSHEPMSLFPFTPKEDVHPKGKKIVGAHEEANRGEQKLCRLYFLLPGKERLPLTHFAKRT